jgi:hypothetical protein
MICSLFPRWSTVRVALVALAALISGVAHAATTTIESLAATRAGITIPLLVIDNSCASGDTTCTDPVATLVLFTGGNGQLLLLSPTGGWQGAPDLSTVRLGPTQNFLVRQRNNFAGPTATDTAEPDLTFNVIMMDVPSDHAGGYPTNTTAGSSFRKSANHQSDIADVIAYARTTFSVPVYLVGTSNGSTSAAKGALIAAQHPDTTRTADGGPDGVVLTSTITLAGDPNDVLDMDLKDIGLTAMIVADSQDQCPNSDQPADRINEIARRLTASQDFRGKIVATPTPYSTDSSEYCQGDGYHGFSNGESKAVDPIRAWIAGHASAQ